MIALVLARTRAAVRGRAGHAASGRTLATASVKDLSAFPVCGSVRPLAAQRRAR